jgi:hypothetical protein
MKVHDEQVGISYCKWANQQACRMGRDSCSMFWGLLTFGGKNKSI